MSPTRTNIDTELIAKKRETFLSFSVPAIEEDEIQAVVEVMRSGWLTTGPKVAKFESDFAHYKNVPEAIAVNSCTAALQLSLIAAGIGPGDEVITTPLTFAASVNCILHVGATPVLADINPRTFNIDPNQIATKINSKTKAILPVHYAGRPCEMDAIIALAKAHGLLVIEDCAHAIETEYKGMKAGCIGDFGCFSFYATKNLATGEGGMILAKDSANLAKTRLLRLHGMSKDAWKRFSKEGYSHYQINELGYKQNMMDIPAAIGIQQLKKIETNWLKRNEIWKAYNKAFSELPITLPAEPEANTKHAYHLYTVLVDELKTGLSRDEFLVAVQKENIGVSVHYLSIPEHPYYQKFLGCKPEDYPHSMRVGRQTLSLPLSPALTSQDVNDVISAVKRVIKNARSKPSSKQYATNLDSVAQSL